jgi:hypothetical protein
LLCSGRLRLTAAPALSRRRQTASDKIRLNDKLEMLWSLLGWSALCCSLDDSLAPSRQPATADNSWICCDLENITIKPTRSRSA